MNEEVTIMEVPLVLRQLVLANNKLLQLYRKELMQQIELANLDMMKILNLDPSLWKLDVDSLKYVKHIEHDNT